MSDEKLVVLDSRRRASLAHLGSPEHTVYLANVTADGTIVLTPAVTISVTEYQLLRDAGLRAAGRLGLSAGRGDAPGP